MGRGRFIAVLGAAGVLAAAAPAVAQQGPIPSAGTPSDGGALLGDIGGLRGLLGDHGITLGLQETSELFGNTSGGQTTTAAYDGETEAVLQMDTAAAFGLPGGTFDASAIDAHGRNLSTDTLGVWQTLTSVEADRALRLWELWYQQSFPGGTDVRLGEQSLDQEFIVDANAAVLVNSAFGWPLLPSLDLPGGGPAYPLSVPGVRVHATLGAGFALLAGLYNGSALPQGCTGNPQHCNPSGTSFPLNGGQMVIAEAQYSVPSAFGGAAATYKIGAWFEDAHGTGLPPRDHGDWSIYGLLDQTLWRQAHGLASLGVFARVAVAPSDRNPVALSATAGLLARAPFAARDQDSASLGIGYGGAPRARAGETVLEATYLAQLRPWLQLQPDAQYFFTPDGGVADPEAPRWRLNNELVLGSRLTAVF